MKRKMLARCTIHCDLLGVRTCWNCAKKIKIKTLHQWYALELLVNTSGIRSVDTMLDIVRNYFEPVPWNITIVNRTVKNYSQCTVLTVTRFFFSVQYVLVVSQKWHFSRDAIVVGSSPRGSKGLWIAPDIFGNVLYNGVSKGAAGHGPSFMNKDKYTAGEKRKKERAVKRRGWKEREKDGRRRGGRI